MNNRDNFNLSIVIPAFNSASTLSKMLSSLLIQTKDYHSQIIVVDDGSTDDTATIVRKYALISKTTKIDLVRQENQGRSITRNKGIQHAHGKILLFMDSDIVPSPQLVRRHMEFHNIFKGIHIGFQGRIIEAKTKNCINWRKSASFLDKSGWITNWTNIIYPNLSLKKAFLINQNELFRVGLDALEDIDFSWRLWKKGLRIYYSFDAIGYHYHPTRTLKEFIERGEWEAKTMNYWIKSRPCIEQMLNENPLRKKFYFISQNSTFKHQIKNFFRKNLMNENTEKYWMFFSEIISKVYFPLAYKIASQLFIRRYIKTYKKVS